MDEEAKALLKRNLELGEANHKLLLGMRRSARWSTLFRVLYWFVILGGIATAYYFIQPYINAVLGAYDSIQGGIEESRAPQGGLPDISSLLQSLAR